MEPSITHQFLDSMFNHIFFQGIYVTALIGLLVSAWGLFLPLNKSQEEKQKKVYPLLMCYAVLMISTVFWIEMGYEGYHPLYHTGLIIFLTVAGIVILVQYLQRFLNKQKTLDKFLN